VTLVGERRSIPKEQMFALTARCEECGGYAFLSRRALDAFKRDGSEIWTYECADCGRAMQKPARKSQRSRS
jgi:DNA-directed RNA polymerase subunit RPC12/RpoP